MKFNDLFRKVATKISLITGSPAIFILAFISILAWILTGPYFHYSDTWQLVINTSTTIITFLMVFLIQNTQNRDTKAIHLKLDELIKSMRGARNRLIDIEEETDIELDSLKEEFQNQHEKYMKRVEKKIEKISAG